MTASAAAILTAAGSGSRLGLGYPKALAQLAACSLVGHAASRLSASGDIAMIVVTAPAEHCAAFGEALATTPGVTVPWMVVAGGASRQASVAAGLAALVKPTTAEVASVSGNAPQEPALVSDATHTVTPYDVVLVHDAARPLAPVSLIRRVIAAVRAGSAAVIPALPVTDTIAAVTTTSEDGGPEAAAETIDRSLLRAIQTPQGFPLELLLRAHAAGAHRADSESSAATDDASLVEALGEPVWIVPGDPRALKITTAHDLAIAQILIDDQEP
jgi:2-C-methyl-D-erythritol 4-phosphate cytidylyltransferase